MMKQFTRSASLFALLAMFTIPASAKEITIRGRLEPTVESGGWLIVVNTKGKSAEYLLLNAHSFQNESWFRAGAVIEATGEVKTDVMTIYQQGTPFEARTLRPVRKTRARASVNRRSTALKQFRSRRDHPQRSGDVARETIERVFRSSQASYHRAEAGRE